ncbi:MAG: TonB family protein [Burkholderiales bacterium]|uniref:energy transducer TonB family protein n=1 Tax=Limnobacter sp. TaxID=2003368 RepID=UPI0039BC7315|nr:TonB family protein [Burkholderiales bacterium]
MNALRAPLGEINLKKALVLSVFLHALLLSVHFAKPKVDTAFSRPLEVILVNAQSPKTPADAKVLAQVALDGGGQADKGRATTLPGQADDTVNQRELIAVQERLKALETLQRNMAGVEFRSELQNEVPDTRQGDDPKSQRALEIKRLQAQIADNIKSYNERPRKHFFSPSTSPYAFAIYEEAWRAKVEQVGNANYPEELKGRIYGKLRLTAYVRADGTLEDIEVDRSSGSAVLDRAALRILRMAAPFPPFPSEMRRKADVLAITRTWVFSRDTISTEY